MDSDVMREIERRLYLYPMIENEVAMLACEYDEEYSLQAVSFHDKAFIARTNKFYSQVEQAILRNDRYDEVTKETIRAKIRISSAIQALYLIHREIITMHYFDGLKFIAVAARLDRSTTYVYDRRMEALKRLEAMNVHLVPLGSFKDKHGLS